MLQEVDLFMEFVIAVINGALLTIAIIAGIGPQNLNTLGHAISRNHAYAVALTCFLADSVLIIFGVIGLRLSESSIILNIINIGGILFLSYYFIRADIPSESSANFFNLS